MRPRRTSQRRYRNVSGPYRDGLRGRWVTAKKCDSCGRSFPGGRKGRLCRPCRREVRGA